MNDGELRETARWIEDHFYGETLADLDEPSCLVTTAKAVGYVVARRKGARGPFAPPAHEQRSPRTGTPPPDAALRSPEWHDYLAQHMQRVLGSLEPIRDEVRVDLGLRPLSPFAPPSPLTRAQAEAWLGGEEFGSEGEGQEALDEPLDGSERDPLDPNEVLCSLANRDEAEAWLTAYIARQPHWDDGRTRPRACVLWWSRMIEGIRGMKRVTVPIFCPAGSHPLFSLCGVAHDVAEAIGWREFEASEWAVGTQPPAPQALSATSYPTMLETRWADDRRHFAIERSAWRYVITVSSGLVSPDEVAAFYRRERNRDYGLPTEPTKRRNVWTAELVFFVRAECGGQDPGAGVGRLD